MRNQWIRSIYFIAFTALGALAGYLYAQHSIAMSVAYMRSHWGWVCGTGLHEPLYIWTALGALVGWIVGGLLWRRLKSAAVTLATFAIVGAGRYH
jgi:hypothetical protein